MPSKGAQTSSLLLTVRRCALPGGEYFLALAHAYFDESGTDDKLPFLCVAGYVFTEENALAIEPPWRKMLEKYRLPYFHMTECNQHEGIYAHLSEQECIAAATEAIELTKAYASRGVAISIDKSVFDALPEQGLWSTPYSLLCSNVMYGVVAWAKDAGFDGDVAYFYESGAMGWTQALEAMKKIKHESSVPRDGLRFSTVTVASKSKAIPLQCADLLAWNWHKQMGREARGILKARGDFRSLLKLKCELHHFDQSAIERWRQDGSPTTSDLLS